MEQMILIILVIVIGIFFIIGGRLSSTRSDIQYNKSCYNREPKIIEIVPERVIKEVEISQPISCTTEIQLPPPPPPPPPPSTRCIRQIRNTQCVTEGSTPSPCRNKCDHTQKCMSYKKVEPEYIEMIGSKERKIKKK